MRSPSSDAADTAPSGFGAVVFDGRRCEYRGCRRCEELRRSAVVPVDVIHLGDVVEHLTAPLDVLRVLVGLLRPTVWLLAQGPLEAGPCVFSAVLRGARKLRSTRPVEMPPYHVLQATVVGQRVIFERAGLEPRNSTVGAEVTAPLDWRRGASAIPDHDCTTEPTSVLEVGAETVL